MNVLYLNHYAGSPAYGMEYRPYYLSREWVRQGHKVRILAADFSHVRAEQPKSPTPGASSWHEWIDGIDYQWFSTPKYEGNGTARVRNIATFLARVMGGAQKILHEFKPDVVIASSTYPMDIWVAKYLARRAGAKLVFELHDLWPLSPIEINGMSPKHPFIRLCQLAENAAYRHADLVVSMLPNVAEHAKSKGLPHHRLAIIQNGFSREEWEGTHVTLLRADVQAVIAKAIQCNQRIVAYTGSHGLANALDTLLDAASILSTEPVCFLLVGDGHERARLLNRVATEKLQNVFMLPPIPKNQIPALLSRVDIAYLGAPPHSLYRFGVSPNKMLDYMMAGVPILYAIKAGNDPIAEADCGLSLKSVNPLELADCTRQLLALPAGRLKEMGKNGRIFALTNHAYDVLAAKFLDYILKTDART